MATPAAPVKEEVVKMGNTAKRDYLTKLEEQAQNRWKEQKVFEVDAPIDDEAALKLHNKWMGTSPYAYMNGSLHLGHAFTYSKIEFAAGYQRMLGKNVLFPVGFHCTGMPIKASADKLVREMEMFGPNFEGFYNPSNTDPSTTLESLSSSTSPAVPSSSDPVAGKSNATGGGTTSTTKSADPSKGKKGKLNAKSTGLTYQFQIMESIGVPREEIKKFADPWYWLEYFPPIAMRDLDSLGCRIDWRRTFATTDINPYYDSFVRWQMNKLRSLDYIKFGKRHTIFSEKDGQPCMDHDRQSGEGVGPMEYTGIRMEIVEFGEKAGKLKEALKGKKGIMIAATLRPETMYGQTACFVSPTITYGVYATPNSNEYFICTERAARNMSHQDLLVETGKRDKLIDVKGEELIGSKVDAPYSLHQQVYVLPMETVLANKGTGVVTCVPSDSPDDFVTTMELRKKAEYYKIDPSWVALDPVPILTTPTYGELTAPSIVKQLKINSPKDTKPLTEAKEKAYMEGFHKGQMILGKYKGESVQQAKEKVKQDMIGEAKAFLYFEPESLVMSRSADECVVALCDQWYMAYGQPGWKEKAEKLVAQMELYNQETRNAFEGVLDWLHEWACSRSYGLGSRIPWDPQYLVESLSDSTIYQVYYTVAHLLHTGYITRVEPGPLGIKPEQMTDEVWSWLFSGDPWPENSPLPREKADILKKHFEYWYPMDIRSSGKDLIGNHLTFCVYVHSALFEERHWPRAMRCNGHLMLNGEKMSKSTGNSLTLAEGVRKFGADATRLALADSGDGTDDANFEEMVANASILRLHTQSEWVKEQIENQDKLRTGPKNLYDKVFENEVNIGITKAREMYEQDLFKDVLKYGFYELLMARDWYRDVTADAEGMHRDSILWFIRIQTLLLTPIAPHFCENVWSELLKEPKSIQFARYPEPSGPVDEVVRATGNYLRSVVRSIREGELASEKKKAQGKDSAYDPSKPKGVRIFVASSFPEWQNKAVEIAKEAWDETANKMDNAKVKEAVTKAGMLKDKRVMPFIQHLRRQVEKLGTETAFNRTLLFDENEVLNLVSPYIKRTLALSELEIIPSGEAAKVIAEKTQKNEPGWDVRALEMSEPGTPGFVFWNVER